MAISALHLTSFFEPHDPQLTESFIVANLLGSPQVHGFAHFCAQTGGKITQDKRIKWPGAMDSFQKEVCKWKVLDYAKRRGGARPESRVVRRVLESMRTNGSA